MSESMQTRMDKINRLLELAEAVGLDRMIEIAQCLLSSRKVMQDVTEVMQYDRI